MTDQSEYLKNDKLITSHYGEEFEHYYNAVVPPIFMNSLNVFETVDDYYDSDKTCLLYTSGRPPTTGWYGPLS